MRNKFSVRPGPQPWADVRPLGLALSLTLAGVLLAGCQAVQTTGAGQVGVTRNQYMGVSSAQVDAASAQSYRKMLQEAERKNQLNLDAAMLARVQGIARRLVAQTSHFRPDAPAWRWETNVLHSDHRSMPFAWQAARSASTAV